MGVSTSTGTLAAGTSKAFGLSPGSAVTLAMLPNCRVSIIEAPNIPENSPLGGDNETRTHRFEMAQTVTYGPYPMGGTVTVTVAANSNSSVAWTREDSLLAVSESGSVSLVDGDGNVMALWARSGITVGPGGEYSTLEAAVERVKIVGTSASAWARIVILPNSNLTLSAEVDMPEYCEVVGTSNISSIITASGNNNIRYRKYNAFRNFKFNYSGTGATSGGFRESANIGAAAQDQSTVLWKDLNINVTANQRPAIAAKVAHYMAVENCQIITSGQGIAMTGGYHLHCRNTDIWLSDVDTNNPHYGIYHTSGRITFWSGKISTGYGPIGVDAEGIDNEADQDIVGIYSAVTVGSERIDVFDLWSIIRNKLGGNAGKKTACVWNNGANGVIRLWSGYLQVENSSGSSAGDNYEILNSATPNAEFGQVIVSPAVRARRVGGHVYQSGPATGLPPITTANATLSIGRGGMYRINPAAGNVTMTLPNPGTGFTPNITFAERYVFKRVISAANTITIAAAGAGVTIQGSASVNLGGTIFDQLEIVWSSDDLTWYIV